MGIFRAAVVQMRSTTDVDRNIAAMEDGVRKAAGLGADYIQTPEMTGLVQSDRKGLFTTIVAQENDPLVARAAELARELSVVLHIGSTPVLSQTSSASGEKAANRAFVFGRDGALVATYDKIHMFDVDLDNGESWRESAVYRPGDKAVLTDIETPNGTTRIGLGICYDLRFPNFHQVYALGGAQVLTVPSCFTRQTGKAHWHALLRARAIENGAWVVAAAQGGDHEDGRTTFGHSLICNPWGEIVAEVASEEPGVAVAEIDPARSQEVRRKIPNLTTHAPFSVICP